jgi:hypothetical protein
MRLRGEVCRSLTPLCHSRRSRSLDQTFGAFDSVAVSMVSHAKFANMTWPFVSLPNFAVKMSKVLPLSDAFGLAVIPVVTPENREAWEEYSVMNDGWINESMAVQETWDGYSGPIVYSSMKNEKIHDDFNEIPANVRYFFRPLHRWPTYRIARRYLIVASLPSQSLDDANLAKLSGYCQCKCCVVALQTAAYHPRCARCGLISFEACLELPCCFLCHLPSPVLLRLQTTYTYNYDWQAANPEPILLSLEEHKVGGCQRKSVAVCRCHPSLTLSSFPAIRLLSRNPS